MSEIGVSIDLFEVLHWSGGSASSRLPTQPVSNRRRQATLSCASGGLQVYAFGCFALVVWFHVLSAWPHVLRPMRQDGKMEPQSRSRLISWPLDMEAGQRVLIQRGLLELLGPAPISRIRYSDLLSGLASDDHNNGRG